MELAAALVGETPPQAAMRLRVTVRGDAPAEAAARARSRSPPPPPRRADVVWAPLPRPRAVRAPSCAPRHAPAQHARAARRGGPAAAN
jgi:hypothetical protein